MKPNIKKHSLLKSLVFRFLFVTLLIATNSQAQQYANNWIDYNNTHKYFKFPIVKEGLYRIDSTTLSNVGFPVANINPQKIQLFAGGKELPVIIQGEADAVFNSTDFIEFYAQQLSADLDSSMYITKGGNPYYSVTSDTMYYFLTWSITSQNGLRMALDTASNIGSYVTESYFIAEEKRIFSGQYYYGATDEHGITEPGYFAEECWAGGEFRKNQSTSITFNPSNIYAGGAGATLNTAIITASDAIGYVTDNRVKLLIQNQQIADSTVNGHKYIKYSLSISPSNLANGTTTLLVQSIDQGAPNSGRMAVPYALLRYPHSLNFENKSYYSFYLPPVASGVIRRVDFNNLKPATVDAIRFYDVTNNLFVKVVTNGLSYSALSKSAGNESKYVIALADTIPLITTIVPVNGTGYFTDFANQLSGVKNIIVSSSILKSSAVQYASHKTAMGIKTEVFFAEELYDQFAYGVCKHPLAIRNFADYAKANFTDVTYLSLLGKSITANLARTGAEYKNNLVPSWGYPASDILLTAGLGGTLQEPLLATGRVSAKNNSELLTYLAKVTEYETNTTPNKFNDGGDWMKQVMHFAGGTNISQAEALTDYLNIYRDTIQSVYYGGNVTTYTKSSTAPIGAVSDTIKNKINDGISIMTFFGHASGAGFDQDIDLPSAYNNNNGKYPLIIGNSCFAGDIHQPLTVSVSNSEQWVLYNKGAIAFIAQVGAGTAPQLFSYTQDLYANIARKNYGGSIGESMKRTIKKVQNPNDPYLRETCLEMTLHGDPTIVINSPTMPDPAVFSAGISTTPDILSTDIDTFLLNVSVKNLGAVVDGPVDVIVEHSYPNSTVADTFYIKTLPSLAYQSSLTFRVGIEPFKMGGINTFKIKVDPLNSISPEVSETNNAVTVSVNITSTEVFPIWPYNYAIVGSPAITLKASTGNNLAPAKNYIIEIDTTDAFNSSLKQSTTINHIGGVIEWTPSPSLWTDTTVYFWRICIQPTNNVYNWKESSFQYIPQKYGWGQSHFAQFKHDNYTFIEYNKPQRRFDFSTTAKNVICETYGNPTSAAGLQASHYRFDTQVIESGGCTGIPAIHVAVIDTLDLTAWGTRLGLLNPTHNFGNYNDNGGGGCRGPRVEYTFNFRPDSASQMAGLENMLQTIPNGYYILLYTYNNGKFNNWPTSLKLYLQSLGAQNIGNLPNNFPYIFFVQKGKPLSAKEALATASTDKLVLKVPLFNNWFYGNIKSVALGAASKWSSLHWESFSRETPSTDSIKLDLIGIKSNGQEQVLLPNILKQQRDVYNLESVIDASVYPHVRLQAYTEDKLNTSPAQLKYWRLYYDGIPEAAVDPSTFLEVSGLPISEGNSFSVKVAVKNVSIFNMDSLRIKYWIEDAAKNVRNLSYTYQKPKPLYRQDSLKALTTMISEINFNTIGLTGNNTLWMEVNPANDQVEQFHFNNYLIIPFGVQRDNKNPLLDVTFDGIRILNGDIVSAKPNIVIELKDENKFLAIDDTSLLSLAIIRPNSTQEEKLYFNNPVIKFTPATLPENKAKIEYAPTYTADGKYRLIVQGKDKSNNRSGKYDYQVEFEVINKSMITEVLNYPNPFSTSTRFVFTLTGSVIPDVFRIQVMSVTGKVVKEIEKEELGLIHIGRNISEYAWDGKDNFGDQLANGVYFYRVITQINGEKIDKYDTQADSFFKKGWGKMYLMR